MSRKPRKSFLLSPRMAWVFLALILVAGYTFRSPGRTWGWGLAGTHGEYVQIHPDEPRFVEIARGLHEDQPYRKGYVLGLGNLLRGWLVLNDFKGIEVSDAALVEVARTVSMLAGLMLVIVAFLIIRRLAGDRVQGLWAAAFVALNTWCVTQSAYGTADMLYTCLLYLFAWVVICSANRPGIGLKFVAAFIAGTAMATKFGIILWPSVFLLAILHPTRKRFLLLCLPALALLVFLVLQGGAFDRASLETVYLSLTSDNLSGFEHSKALNLLVYPIQLVRILGIPVVVFAGVGWWCCRKQGGVSRNTLVAFLPIMLHGIAVLGLNTSFPRHLVPLVPLFLMLAAVGLGQMRGWAWPAVTLAWTVLLTTTDATAIWKDIRSDAMHELVHTVPGGTTVWASPYYNIPLDHVYTMVPPGEAEVLVVHEGWYFRFERSELNPLSPPETSVYHASPGQLAWYRELEKGLEEGRVELLYQERPPVLLPEQHLYRAFWGNLNKFAGDICILQQKAPAK